MNGTVVVGRTGSEGWRTARWMTGAALGSQVLAGLAFGFFIGVGEVTAVVLGLTEQSGVPLFRVLLRFAVVAYAAALHLAVRVAGESVEVPWVIWPAMTAIPTAWIFVALADPSGALEPALAVLDVVGIVLAFATLGHRRWTSGSVQRGPRAERSGDAPVERKAARWPYILGLCAAVLGAAGLAYAPFSAIVYPLALPGLGFAPVWAVKHRSPMRMPLAAATALLAIGFMLASLGLFGGAISSPTLFEDAAFVFMLVLPALGLGAAIPATATALSRARAES